MCDTCALDHPGALQRDWLRGLVEQPDAVPEEDRHQIEVYLVEKSRSDALLYQARTDHADIVVTGDRFRLRYRAFEAVRDECKRRSFVNPLLRNRMGKNKDRYPQRMSATPSVGEVEGSPSPSPKLLLSCSSPEGTPRFAARP